MEEKISEAQPVEVSAKPKRRWFKIVLHSILGSVLAASLVFAGYKLGRRQIQPAPQPTLAPTLKATGLPARSSRHLGGWQSEQVKPVIQSRFNL